MCPYAFFFSFALVNGILGTTALEGMGRGASHLAPRAGQSRASRWPCTCAAPASGQKQPLHPPLWRPPRATGGTPGIYELQC